MAAAIVGAYPVVLLIHRWVDGETEAPVALAGIGLYLALMVSEVMAPTGIKIGILGLVFGIALGMPKLDHHLTTADRAQAQEAELEGYARALELNPMDAPARLAFAEMLYARGEQSRAIEEMEWALQHFPQLSAHIRPQLDYWKRLRSVQETLPTDA